MKPKFLIIGAVFLIILTMAVLALITGDTSTDVPTLVVRHAPFAQRVTAEGTLEAVKSTSLTVPITASGAQKIAWLIKDGARVTQGDIVVRFDPTDLELDRDNGQDDQLMADHRLRKAEVERNAKLKNLDRDAKLSEQEASNARTFKNTDDLVYSRNEIIESEIDTELAEERAQHAELAKDIESRLSKTGLELLEINRQRASLKIRQAEDGLKSLQIVAPHDGIAIFERDWLGNLPQVGETVWSGRSLASIPELDEMEINIFVLEADAGGLAAGQRAEITLEAHPGRRYPARVKSVDPIAQRRVRWVPVQYFRAVLTLDETDPALMKPGQRIQGEIFIAEETSAIAIPRQAVSTIDGIATVHRLENGQFRKVAVKIGASALGKVVVTLGLQDDDIIALRDPGSGSGNKETAESSFAIGGAS